MNRGSSDRNVLPEALVLARSLTQNYVKSIPVDVFVLAQQLDVLSVEPSDITIDGYLGRLLGGSLVIRYKASNPRQRNRFTIAHELGHLLLYRAAHQEVPHCAMRGFVRDTAEERSANRVASELLMPREAVYQRLQRKPLSWGTVCQLAREFDVSISAMAMRILEVAERPVVLLRAVLDPGNHLSVSNWRCSISENHRLLFAGPPGDETKRIVLATHNGQSCTLNIFTTDSVCELVCRSMKFNRFSKREVWILCAEDAPIART